MNENKAKRLYNEQNIKRIQNVSGIALTLILWYVLSNFTSIPDLYLPSPQEIVQCFIKYSKDDVALQKVLDSDKVYENIDRETAELIRDVTNSEMEFEEGQVINVCLAEQNMKKKAVRESALETAKALLSLGKVTIDEIASVTKLPIDEIE